MPAMANAAKLDGFTPSVQFTEGQSKAFAEIATLGRDQWYVLKGYAGTGKSTVIVEACRYLERQGKRVALTAPTNKAVKVLRRMADKNNLLDTECLTIYSLLALRPMPDGAVKKVQQTRKVNLREFDLVVIDECSMINAQLMVEIRKAVKKAEGQEMLAGFGPGMPGIVFMGDPAQLPPVHETHSQSFEAGDEGDSELTHIVRQAAGNPVLTLTGRLRECIAANRLDYGIFEHAMLDGGKGVGVLSRKDWAHWALEAFATEQFAADSDSFRVLAWTNARVREVNMAVRERVIGKTETPFIVGELALCKTPIQRVMPDGSSVGVHRVDDEVRVASIKETELVGVPVYELRLEDAENEHKWAPAHIPTAEGMPILQAELNRRSAAARENRSLWVDFWEFKERFAELQHIYALTAHRSQGSTFSTVFVDVEDMTRNPVTAEMLRMLYVAVSRASQAVFLRF